MFYQDNYAQVLRGDAREVLPVLPEHSVDMCMTSPPYWGLRLYHGEPSIWDGDANCQHEWGDKKTFNLQWRRPELSGSGDVQVRAERNEAITQGQFCRLCGAWHGQLGLEPDPDLFCKHLCDIFDLVRKVLKPTGVMFVNLSDSYAGSGKASGQTIDQVSAKQATNFASAHLTQGNFGVPAKSLVGIPFRFALEMVKRGFILRNTIIWYKRSAMPESVKDRFTRDYEFIFFFSLQQHYYFEQQFEPYSANSKPEEVYTGKATKDYAEALAQNPSDSKRRILESMKTGQGRNRRCVWDITSRGSSLAVYDYENYDYVGEDGKPYKVSPNCPIHGQHHGKESQRKVACDEQPSPRVNDTADNANGLSQVPESGCVSMPNPCDQELGGNNTFEQIDHNTAQNKISGVDMGKIQISSRTTYIQRKHDASRDCSSLIDESSAISHNSENCKTDPAQLTNSFDNSSLEISAHIPCKSIQPSLSVPYADNHENNISEGVSVNAKGTNPLERKADDKTHKSHSNYTCTCRISQVSHYASYPEELCVTPILAGCPEFICPVCHKPRVKIYESEPNHRTRLVGVGQDSKEGVKGRAGELINSFIGYSDCGCGAEFYPGVVLDPFMGTGTTNIVAKKLGRKSIGIDVSEKYCKISARRLAKIQGIQKEII